MPANPPLVINRWVMLAVLTTARLALGFQFQSIGSTAPFLVADLGIDYAKVGFLIGLYLLPGVVMAFPGGFLGRRFGDKRVAATGLLLMSIGGILVAASDSYELVVAGRLVSGFGAVLLNVLLTKMTTDWFADKEIVLAMAILLNAWPIGIAIALVTLGPLAEVSSWSAAFYATAAVAFVGLLLVAALYRSPEGVKVTSRERAKIFSLSFREVGLVSLAGVVWAFFNVAYAVMSGFAPSFLISRGESVADAGFIISLNTWLFVASVQIGGMLVQRWGRPNTIIVVGITVWGTGLVLMPLVSSPLWVIAAMGIFGGAPAGAIAAIPAEILKPENRGPGLGLFISWLYGAMPVLLPIAGWLRDLSGNAAAPLYFGGLVMVTSLPFLGLLRGLQRRPTVAHYPTL